MRDEKTASYKALDLALKKKRKAANKAAAKTRGLAFDDSSDEGPEPIPDEPLDEEAQRKKDAVLDAL